MNSGIIPISNVQLLLSVILILLTGAVSAALKLGLLQSLAWGTFRTFVQLILIGYVLSFVFRINNLLLLLPILLLMCLMASRTAVGRMPHVDRYPTVLAFLSLLASTFLVGFIVVALIIAPEPWYETRIAIPIFGMLLGNSMNGIALSLDRLYSEVRSRVAEVETLLTLGATPWEAVQDCVKAAVRAGMMPTINSMMVVGLVSLPGMMTGQILGGVDPKEAVRYQIVVQLMIAATVAIGCLLLVGLSYSKLFTKDAALQPVLLKSVLRNGK